MKHDSIKFFKLLLISIIASIMIGCLTLTLFFGIAVISAIAQVGFAQLTVLFSLSCLFGIASYGSMLLLDILYASVRR